MAEEGDPIVSLPPPPPPRPSARRQAIEAALSRFDGTEPAPARQKSRGFQWPRLQGRPAGALVAATLIAVIAIPVVQIAVREKPPSEVIGVEPPAPATPSGPSAQPPAAADRSPDHAAPESIADKAGPSLDSLARKAPAAAEQPLGLAPAAREEKAQVAAAAPSAMVAAPPAPPPPPPPPATPRRAPAEPEAQAEAEMADTSDNIVVTGSRIERRNLASAAPVTVIDPYGEFLSRLQSAFAAIDRRAILRLVGFPLRVDFDGEARTYRSAGDVERDFDRIFTPRVRAAALELGRLDSAAADGSRLRGNARIRFGCGSRRCLSGDAVRIREVTP